MVGIYTITSPANKIYVGQSWNIEFRFSHYMSISPVKNQRYIYNSLKKYGVANHKFEVILELRDDVSQATLDCWEEYFYNLYKTQGYELLNLALPGRGSRLTEETKKRLSDAHRGRKLTEEWKRNIGKAHKGKKVPESSVLKMKQSLKEYYSRHKGYWAGKELTPELKKTFGNNLKKGADRSTSRKVLQFDKHGNFIKEWSYIKEIKKVLGIQWSNVSDCCHLKRKTAGGFVWKFKNPESC